MHNLGGIYLQLGMAPHAEQCLRRAVAAGSAGALNDLGNLLELQGDREFAAEYWRAAEAGVPRAMCSLGMHLVTADSGVALRRPRPDGTRGGCGRDRPAVVRRAMITAVPPRRPSGQRQAGRRTSTSMALIWYIRRNSCQASPSASSSRRRYAGTGEPGEPGGR